MRKDKIGVLLVNIGTPDAPTKKAVKSYLKQFLSDKRVIDLPKWLWWPILNLVVLPVRSRRLASLYSTIWMEEGSPLMVYSQKQYHALSEKLDIPVTLGMRYGNPNLKGALNTLMANGITKLIILTLYPQFSSSTVAAVWDEINYVFSSYRNIPSVYFMRDYAQHPAYIAALRESVQRSFKTYGKPDLLITSFHGIPQRFVNEGDDYPQRCYETFILLKNSLHLKTNEILLTFQSRFGYEPWIKPYTKDILTILPRQGIKNVQIISPSFASDCLETLEEINTEHRKIFIGSGGSTFNYIPALNDGIAHINMMVELVKQHC
ncbi:ferrochelatase [Candidatus Erwinia haradaeae]|uniref:Ferrochelatase n=1 Tax=Candidatus Erwinia haradaeae TaxID=1922217 RepID=A0A451D240_9GAMM|nr:ferrochelatase [Candidatus Erwinia haradaeae]VFP79682.1 Ferrochelatase [Candidatus Erwinia haradaeae]